MNSSNAQHSQRKSKGRWIPYILFVVFFGPLLLSYALYYNGSYVGDEGTENGQLILPPMLMSKLPLTTKQGDIVNDKKFDDIWTLMYVAPHQCGDVCTQNIYNMRQVRKALGKGQTRVQRLLVTFNEQYLDGVNQQLNKKYSGMQVAFTSDKAYKNLIKSQPFKTIALKQGYMYVVDPNGNIMMSYAPDSAARGILKDLKKLLKVSQIG